MDTLFGQNELLTDILKVNKNVVLVFDNAVEMPLVKDVPATVQAWNGGTECGDIIANIFSEDVISSGKLPFTFPVKPTDKVAISFGKTSYPRDENGHKEEYKEGILSGNCWHDTKTLPPLFAFGNRFSLLV